MSGATPAPVTTDDGGAPKATPDDGAAVDNYAAGGSGGYSELSADALPSSASGLAPAPVKQGPAAGSSKRAGMLDAIVNPPNLAAARSARLGGSLRADGATNANEPPPSAEAKPGPRLTADALRRADVSAGGSAGAASVPASSKPAGGHSVGFVDKLVNPPNLAAARSARLGGTLGADGSNRTNELPSNAAGASAPPPPRSTSGSAMSAKSNKLMFRMLGSKHWGSMRGGGGDDGSGTPVAAAPPRSGDGAPAATTTSGSSGLAASSQLYIPSGAGASSGAGREAGASGRVVGPMKASAGGGAKAAAAGVPIVHRTLHVAVVHKVRLPDILCEPPTQFATFCWPGGIAAPGSRRDGCGRPLHPAACLSRGAVAAEAHAMAVCACAPALPCRALCQQVESSASVWALLTRRHCSACAAVMLRLVHATKAVAKLWPWYCVRVRLLCFPVCPGSFASNLVRLDWSRIQLRV